MAEYVWQGPSSLQYSSELLNLVGDNPIVAQALVQRGFSSPEKALPFLDPAKYKPSHPTDLPDLEKAVARVQLAMRRKERVAVWGDFDVDGQTSTTLLVSGLKRLGADVIFHIPVRAVESHGINIPGLKSLVNQGVTLVITCDTGITAHEAAEFCQSAGIDLIITDHHSLPPHLPDAFAAVNPLRLPDQHPAHTLSGVGCAYQFLFEIASQSNQPEVAADQLDLVALGLVADLAELTGDCRYLVQRGLSLIRKKKRLALSAIAETAGLDLANATEEHISFVIAPRLNALGRLGDANGMVEFFTTSDSVQASVIATQLDGLNNQRKLLCDQVFTAALAQIEKNRMDRDQLVLVVDHPQWPAGILGIAASRLVEIYHRPVILLNAPPGEIARGSARSVDGINITAAIAASAPILSGFGGHPMAAGLSLDVENISQFRREINRTIVSGSVGSLKTPTLTIDAYLNFPEISLDLVKSLEIMAPFGQGNPPILLATHDLEITAFKTLGRPGDHLQLTLQDAFGSFQKVIWWNGAGRPLPQGKFDLAYHLRSTSYLGEPQIQIEWVAGRQPDRLPAVEINSADLRQWTDYRSTQNPNLELKQIVEEGNCIIWQEGTNFSHFPGLDRFQIPSGKNLVIWTSPPGWIDLYQVVQSAKPEHIFIFSQPALPAKPAEVIKHIVGIIQYATHNYDGWITIQKISALTAQRELTIQKAVELILARPLYNLVTREGDRLQFSEASTRIFNKCQSLEKEFSQLADETNAFRNLFMHSTLEEIQEKIRANK